MPRFLLRGFAVLAAAAAMAWGEEPPRVLMLFSLSPASVNSPKRPRCFTLSGFSPEITRRINFPTPSSSKGDALTFFVFDRIKQLAPQHPEWKDKEPFASVFKGDVKSALAGGEHALLEMVMATHAGMTTEKTVTEWITTAKHPKTGRLFTEMVCQPMLELLAYLRANCFKTFIVSGGGIEFIDDKAGKPVGINQHIGHRPIAAFGNSDGDFQMLEWTTSGKGQRFGLIVHHTDAEREFAYDRESHFGSSTRASTRRKRKAGQS